MLAEFKYGGVPKETFNGALGGYYDQAVPRRTFWHLKKDFFRAAVESVLLYGSTAWTLTTSLEDNSMTHTHECCEQL